MAVGDDLGQGNVGVPGRETNFKVSLPLIITIRNTRREPMVEMIAGAQSGKCPNQ